MWVLLFLQMTTQGLLIDRLERYTTYDECIEQVIRFTPELKTNSQILACVKDDAQGARYVF